MKVLFRILKGAIAVAVFLFIFNRIAGEPMSFVEVIVQAILTACVFELLTWLENRRK